MEQREEGKMVSNANIMGHVASYLDNPKDIAVFEQVCTLWGRAADQAWKNKIETELTTDISRFSVQWQTNKERYKLFYDTLLCRIETCLSNGRINKADIITNIHDLAICSGDAYDTGIYDEERSASDEKFRQQTESSFFYQSHFTPLSLAVIAGFEKLTLSLLSKGAKVDVPNTYIMNNSSDIERGYFTKHEMTHPLHEAVLFRQKKCINILLNNNADINQDSYFGRPLSIAINYGYVDVVDLLIKSRAEKNYQIIRGQTPLHEAAEKGDRKINKLLLDNGAKDVANDDGMKPSDIAREKGYDLMDTEEKVVDLDELLDWGERSDSSCGM